MGGAEVPSAESSGGHAMRGVVCGAALLVSQGAMACDLGLHRANAMFIRSVAHCKQNYMDTPAAYVALGGAKSCARALKEPEMERYAKEAFQALDDIAAKQGKDAACKLVETLQREI